MDSPFQRYLHLGATYQNKIGFSEGGKYLHCLSQAHKIDTFLYSDILSSSSPSDLKSQYKAPCHSLSIAEGCGIQDFVPSPWDTPGYFVSCAQHPIQLWDLTLPDSSDGETSSDSTGATARVISSYAFNDSKHEAVQTAYLTLATNGDPYLLAAGARSIRVYDVRHGSRHPLHDVRLFVHGHPGGRALDARPLKGPVSCLAAQRAGMLAVGTLEGQVGVLARHGAAGLVCAMGAGPGRGRGVVTQVRWSEARPWYLYVARRGAECVQMCDLRHFSGPVGGWGGSVDSQLLELKGWKSETNVRLSFDVFQVADIEYGRGEGEWLLAGTSDGRVVGWRDPWATENDGAEKPDWEAKIHGEVLPVAAVLAHPDGTLITGCSSDRFSSEHWWDVESSSSSEDEISSNDDEQEEEQYG